MPLFGTTNAFTFSSPNSASANADDGRLEHRVVVVEDGFDDRRVDHVALVRIASALRLTKLTKPSASPRVTRSPLRYQPPRHASAVLSGRFQYSVIVVYGTVGRTTISPVSPTGTSLSASSTMRIS